MIQTSLRLRTLSVRKKDGSCQYVNTDTFHEKRATPDPPEVRLQGWVSTQNLGTESTPVLTDGRKEEPVSRRGLGLHP